MTVQAVTMKRMIEGMKRQVSLWIALLLATSAFGQDDADTGQLGEIPRYTVEIIIFSYQQDVSVGSEIFVPDAPPPVEAVGEQGLADGILLKSTPEIIAPEPVPDVEDTARKFELSMLDEDDFTLQGIYDRLERLDAYEPLMHFGWTQSTYPEEETEPRPLSFYATPPAGLEGDLKLYLSRYLHLALNLQLDAPGAAPTRSPDTRYGYEPYDSRVVNYPVHYRIKEDRIFRSGETRYFDHPKFGVLAKITRAENAPDDKYDINSETELLGDGE
jgi:Peptidoglycan-binding protein, CsiV